MNTYEVEEVALMFAFRYALTRPHKQAEVIVYTLKYHWNKLPQEFRNQVKQEIAVATYRDDLPGANEVALWDQITNL